MPPAPVPKVVKVADLHPDPDNPRDDETPDDELIASVATSGVLQSLLVRPDPDGGYVVIAGHRRYRASVEAKIATVPVLVVDDLTPEEVLAYQLVENMHRVQLNPIEQARGLERLRRMTNAKQVTIAALTGLTQTRVSMLLRLLKLPPEVQVKVATGEIGVVRALGGDVGHHLARATSATRDADFERLRSLVTKLGTAITVKDKVWQRQLATEAVKVLRRWAPKAAPTEGEPPDPADVDHADDEPESIAPMVRCDYCNDRVEITGGVGPEDRARALASHRGQRESCRLKHQKAIERVAAGG